MNAAPLRQALRRALGPRGSAVRSVAAAARAQGARSFLVGGPVRDLLLDQPIGDLDFLLSQSLAPVARAVARELGGRVLLRPEFQTATIEANSLRVDLVRARCESYSRPGALPSVAPGEIAQDLARRDFTIQAMALPLDAQSGRRLLDPHRGLEDLAAGQLRVLYEMSFRDDPTRLLRAARYAGRLGLAIAPPTRRLFGAALREGALDWISADRVRHELERALLEARPERVLARSLRLGLLEALVPGWPAPDARALARLGAVALRPPWQGADRAPLRIAAGLRLFTLGSHSARRARIAARLGLRGTPRRELEQDGLWLARQLRARALPGADGALDARLDAVSEAALLALHCAAPAPVARRVAYYARALRMVPTPIDGHRARALGLRGPEIGALLAAARRRSLDGRPVDTSWLESFAQRRRAARAAGDC